MPESQLQNSDNDTDTDNSDVIPKTTGGEEDEILYHPSKFDQIVQILEDALREAYNLDPTGEGRAVVIGVTTTNGKIIEIVADSTEDQRFKGWEVWSKAFVEAEVTKVQTAFYEDNQQKNNNNSKKTPV